MTFVPTHTLRNDDEQVKLSIKSWRTVALAGRSSRRSSNQAELVWCLPYPRRTRDAKILSPSRI